MDRVVMWKDCAVMDCAVDVVRWVAMNAHLSMRMITVPFTMLISDNQLCVQLILIIYTGRLQQQRMITVSTSRS